MKEFIVNLEISSFYGICAGATHYYGKLCFNNDRIDLERKITKRNIKDFKNENYHIGDITTRFNSEEHVIRAAKRVWKKTFPNAIVLLLGSSAIYDPQKCIDGPITLKIVINHYYKQAEEIGGYEGNIKEMTKISDEYMKTLKEYVNLYRRKN